MLQLTALGFGLALVVALFAWLVSRERSGDSLTAVLLILGLVVFESTLYENQSEIPAGLFHPTLGPQSFRLFDVVIPLALAARLYARGLPKRLQVQDLLWFAFFTWLVVAAIVGYSLGNDPQLIAFEAKAIIYLGAMGLAASVPVERYTQSKGLVRLLYGSSALATLFTLLDQTDTRFDVNLPGVSVEDAGVLGADAATIFVALGLVAIALALCRDRHRLPLLVAAGPLLGSAIVSEQRAAVLGLVLSLAMLAVLVPMSGKRLRTTPTEIGIVLMLLLGLLLLPTFVSVVTTHQPNIAFSDSVERMFFSRGKVESAQARRNQWQKAPELIEERPLFGWGLGKTYTHFEPGPDEFVTTDLTHNVEADLLVRSGIVGLVLFLLAVGATLWSGVVNWRRHADRLSAALALACVAILAGLLGKGQVESIFEKYRVAVLFGLTLGILSSAAASRAARLAEQKESLQWR